MSQPWSQPVVEAWAVGARVAIFGAADSERWATLGPLVQRALAAGRAVVVADQGLDPLAEHLEVLADTLGVSLQRWPTRQTGMADWWRGWWRDRGAVPALPPFEALLWIDLPASGLDVAGFVEAVHGWRQASADAPMVVVAHDLAWRDDAAALLDLWDAAATSDGRLCAILTMPGLPSEPRLRSALLEASLVGVHRIDSHADAAVLADYLNQPLQDGVAEHAIRVHDHTNVLPIAEFWLTVPDDDLPLVLVDATGRPDFVDLFRVTAAEGAPPELRVGWTVSPVSVPERSIQMTCQVVRPVTTAYTLWFQAPEHTALLRRIATAGWFLLGVQAAEDADSLDAWRMESQVPSFVRAALDRW